MKPLPFINPIRLNKNIALNSSNAGAISFQNAVRAQLNSRANSKVSQAPNRPKHSHSTSMPARTKTILHGKKTDQNCSCLKKYSKIFRLQTGDMLIEALIGLVLMAIVAVGVTTITSKVEKGKREMSVQDLAVSQLQELLVKNGNGSINLCDSTPETISLPDETISVDVTGCASVAATINGVAFTDLKQPIVLSATSGKYNAKYTVGGVASQN